MKKNKLFSALLIELTNVWIEWMKYNGECKNEKLSIKEKALMAEKCEELIDRRYEILNQLDSYFTNIEKKQL